MYKRRGFTLVELLVVIAIIALLMSILMPTLAKVKKQAKAVACMSNLSEWGKIFLMYTDEHDGYFMGGWYDQIEGWMNSLRSYVDPREGGLACCPMVANIRTKPDNLMEGSTLMNWGGPNCFAFYGGKVGDYGSYGSNSFINNMPADYGLGPDHWRRSDAKGAVNIPVFADSTFPAGWSYPTDPPPEYEGAMYWSGVIGCNAIGVFCINRHDGAVNVLFMDWSVRRVRLKRLWTLKWNRSYDVSGPWTLAGGVTYQDWAEVGTGWMAPFPY